MLNITRSWVCRQCAGTLRQYRCSYSAPSTTTSSRLGIQRRTYAGKPHAQDGRPFRMAVIGSGPAGFYTSYKVMSKIENSVVDMYEHLPVPFGLVRFGVAPDHPEVKVRVILLKKSRRLKETEISSIELPGKVRRGSGISKV